MVRGGKEAVPKKKRSGMVLIVVIIAVLAVVLMVRSASLSRRNAAYAEEIGRLTEQITEEEGRTEKIKAYKAYTDSDSFVEKTAREKFGLVYPDEVIYRQEG